MRMHAQWSGESLVLGSLQGWYNVAVQVNGMKACSRSNFDIQYI